MTMRYDGTAAFDPNRIPEWARYAYVNWRPDAIFGTKGLRAICYTTDPMILVDEQWIVPAGRIFPVSVDIDKDIPPFKAHHFAKE